MREELNVPCILVTVNPGKVPSKLRFLEGTVSLGAN